MRVLFGNAVTARLSKPRSHSRITRVVTRKREGDLAMSTYSPFVMDEAICLFERWLGSEGNMKQDAFEQ